MDNNPQEQVQEEDYLQEIDEQVMSKRRALGVGYQRGGGYAATKSLDGIRNSVDSAIKKKDIIWVSYNGHKKPFIPRAIRPQAWDMQRKESSFFAIQHRSKSQKQQRFYLKNVLEVRDKQWRISNVELDQLKNRNASPYNNYKQNPIDSNYTRMESNYKVSHTPRLAVKKYAEVDLCRNKFEDWLCNVVCLDRYRTVFQDNGYDDITMIPFMDEDVIQDELGISNKLHCKLILKRIDEFKAMVCEFDAFLDANVALKHYEDNLKERGIITMMHLKEDIQHKKDISRIVGIKQKANVHKIWNIIYGPCVSDAEEEPDKKTLNVELAHKQIMHIRNRIAQRSGPPHSMQSGPQSASMYAGSASIPHPSGLTGSAPMVGTGAVAPQPHQSSVATGQSSAPMLEVNPLTAEMLQDAKPAEKKRLIAERLFAKIQVVEPCLAGKITGMLLEMDNTELLVLLTEQRALMNKINEALAVLKDHQQKQLLQNPGSTKCFYK